MTETINQSPPGSGRVLTTPAWLPHYTTLGFREVARMPAWLGETLIVMQPKEEESSPEEKGEDDG